MKGLGPATSSSDRDDEIGRAWWRRDEIGRADIVQGEVTAGVGHRRLGSDADRDVSTRVAPGVDDLAGDEDAWGAGESNVGLGGEAASRDQKRGRRGTAGCQGWRSGAGASGPRSADGRVGCGSRGSVARPTRAFARRRRRRVGRALTACHAFAHDFLQTCFIRALLHRGRNPIWLE